MKHRCGHQMLPNFVWIYGFKTTFELRKKNHNLYEKMANKFWNKNICLPGLNSLTNKLRKRLTRNLRFSDMD